MSSVQANDLRANDLGRAAIEPDRTRTHRRFDRTARLLGEHAMTRLGRSKVTVVGLGGVGASAAEALARSGVGHLTLVDFDRICITNANRQLHAMKGAFGKPKVDIMAERLRLIHPDATIEVRRAFFHAATADVLLCPEPDLVIDAIDNVTAKTALIATCIRMHIPLVTSMGAAARLDPTLVRTADLSRTHTDRFAADVRKVLRAKHGIDTSRALGVPAVFSVERAIAPKPLAYDEDGFQCVCPGGKNGLNDCEQKHVVEGSAAFVPVAFGMTAASLAVRMLTHVGLAPAASVLDCSIALG